MSALLFETLKGRGRTCDACAPTSERGALRVARHKATVLGHPLGLVCGPCKIRWQEAWDSALEVDLDGMHEEALEQAA